MIPSWFASAPTAVKQRLRRPQQVVNVSSGDPSKTVTASADVFERGFDLGTRMALTAQVSAGTISTDRADAIAAWDSIRLAVNTLVVARAGVLEPVLAPSDAAIIIQGLEELSPNPEFWSRTLRIIRAPLTM